jgi:hypothetical protein
MGQSLDTINSNHSKVKTVNHMQNMNILTIEKVNILCKNWKDLGIPFIMSINEFQKSVVQSEDIHINYERYKSSEIEVLGFLTKLIVVSNGSLEKKLKCKTH